MPFRRAALYLFAGLGVFVAFASYLVIPFHTRGAYLSPDETAMATFAQQFAKTGTMRIPFPGIFASMHPRSIVVPDNAMVPVGFLGFPMLLGLIWFIFGAWGLLLVTPLLVVSAAYPLARFMKKQGTAAQFATVAVWLSYPAVILYANRGLFPNLPVVCLVIWACWLVWEKNKTWSFIIAGLLTGLALAIRPVEFVWIAPWLWLAWSLRHKHPLLPKEGAGGGRLAWFAAAALIPMLAAGGIAWATYGSPFAIGYWLHDAGSTTLAITSVTSAATSQLKPSLFPFGIHPRDVWFNFNNYVLGLLLAWTMLLVVGAVATYRFGKKNVLAVGVWTLVVLLGLYGEGIYQDHVGVNVVSIGNSFIRYLLPLAPMIALSAGALVAAEASQGKRWLRVLAAVYVVGLVVFGFWLTFTDPDEGVVAAAHDVASYADIRAASQKLIMPDTIVISPRSDKIFFPAWLAVSPLPSVGDLKNLETRTSVPLALFDEQASTSTMATWEQNGFGLTLLQSFGHEALYRLEPTGTSP